MAFNRNKHFQISKNVEFFIKKDKFLKKVDTESVLYTCCVANKRNIFSSLILIFGQPYKIVHYHLHHKKKSPGQLVKLFLPYSN